MFQAFVSADRDWSGDVSLSELVQYMQVPHTRLLAFVFSHAMESDSCQERTLQFPGFLAMVWNFATMDRPLLARLILELFDADDSGDLDEAERTALVRFVHAMEGSGPRVTRAVRALVAAAPIATAESFAAVAVTHPILVAPAERLQRLFRKRVLGAKYFEGAARFRSKTYPPLADLATILRHHDAALEASRLTPQTPETATVDGGVGNQVATAVRVPEADWTKWARIGPSQRAQELSQLVLDDLQAEATEALSMARRNGLLSSAELLECPGLCKALRRTELQLLQCQQLLSASIEEQVKSAGDRLRHAAEDEAWAQFRSDARTRRDVTMRRAEFARRYRAAIEHGFSGDGIIPPIAFDANQREDEAFPALAGSADATDLAATRHVLGLVAEDTHRTLVEAEPARLERWRSITLARLSAQLDSLLSLHGIDDSHVDYTSWRRGFDRAASRFFWDTRAEGSSARVFVPPRGRGGCPTNLAHASKAPGDQQTNDWISSATGKPDRMVRAADTGFRAVDAGDDDAVEGSAPQLNAALTAAATHGASNGGLITSNPFSSHRPARQASPFTRASDAQRSRPVASHGGSARDSTTGRRGSPLPPRRHVEAARIAAVGAVHPAERGLAALLSGSHADGTPAPFLFHGTSTVLTSEPSTHARTSDSQQEERSGRRPLSAAVAAATATSLLRDAAAVLQAMRHEELTAPFLG